MLQLSEIEGVDQPAAVTNGDGKRVGEEGEETEEKLIKKVLEFQVSLLLTSWKEREGVNEGWMERGRE